MSLCTVKWWRYTTATSNVEKTPQQPINPLELRWPTSIDCSFKILEGMQNCSPRLPLSWLLLAMYHFSLAGNSESRQCASQLRIGYWKSVELCRPCQSHRFVAQQAIQRNHWGCPNPCAACFLRHWGVWMAVCIWLWMPAASDIQLVNVENILRKLFRLSG